MENIPLIIDRLLLFAAHRTYTLAAGLELLRVALQVDILSTHHYIARRFVPNDGHNFARSPAKVNDDDDNDHRFSTAIKHGQIEILDQCIANGIQVPLGLADFFTEATWYAQVPSLEWLRAYAIQHHIAYVYRPVDRFHRIVALPAARQIALLNWWKAEYASRQQPLVRKESKTMPGIALSADDGMQVVEWWREYCAEQGRPFRWPVLTSQTLWHLIKYGSVEFCDWWWKDTVRQLGTLAIERMRDMVNLICDHGRRDLLDWYWDVCQTHNNKRFFKLAFRSHPRRPFFHLSVIEWWNAKVESGQVSEHVFDFWDADGLPLDVLFSMLEPLVMELDALDWWWARRERFGLEAHLSPLVFAHLMTSEQYALLQWYLNRCTRDSPLPDLTLSNLSAMFAAGQVGLVEQIWQLSVAHGQPLKINTRAYFSITGDRSGHMNLCTQLDYLWDICSRVGARFEPCYKTESAIKSMIAGDLDAGKWWYAMHRVHGTAFPSAAELSSVKCAPAMTKWIRSIQNDLQ